METHDRHRLERHVRRIEELRLWRNAYEGTVEGWRFAAREGDPKVIVPATSGRRSVPWCGSRREPGSRRSGRVPNGAGALARRRGIRRDLGLEPSNGEQPQPLPAQLLRAGRGARRGGGRSGSRSSRMPLKEAEEVLLRAQTTSRRLSRCLFR